MRFGRAGIIFLSLLSLVCLAPLALAQAEGEVESIGFGGYYRTNCWTPMKLRLRPKIGNAETYLIQVIQEDIDRDRVMYTRPFTLSGNPEGGRTEERVWVYFIPDAREPRSQSLNDSLKVFLCDRNGKQLVRIATAGIPPLAEPELSRSFWGQRTAKLVLMVGDSGSRPITDIYGGAKGITEDIIFQKVALNELPTSVNGYDAVDAIVWLNADPNELNADAMAAIEDYVRDGGRLAVCGNANTWQRVMASDFAPMLPVVMNGVGVDEGLVSLRQMTDLPGSGLGTNVNWVAWAEDGSTVPFDPWGDKAAAQSPLVLATAKRGTLVHHVAANAQQTPYLARWMYGLGEVIWIAQDFGDPNVVSTTPYRSLGWAQVWNRVFDWQNTPYTRLMLGEGMENRAVSPWVKSYREKETDAGFSKNAFASDLSTAMLDPMNPGKTGGLLIGLAIVFFIGYWVIAGPGSYFFLLAKKQAHLSWFAYALCALVATGLTVLIVQGVLRGPPVLQHVSLVRTGPQKEGVVRSQFGLYVKQDGNQELSMKQSLPKRASYITPYPMHWSHLPQSGAQFLGNKEYTVPMRDRNSTEDPTIAVPFRSTLKKFQAKWVGEKESIEGQVTMESIPTGKLLNSTGQDLHDVYLIYMAGRDSDGLAQDMMVYLPDLKGKAAWVKGDMLNLVDIMTPQKTRAIIGVNTLPGLEGDDIAYRGALTQNAWLGVLFYGMGGSFTDNMRFGDTDRAALLLSIFERLRPMRPQSENRLELLRYSNRHWDASHVVACGHLLIIARGSPNRAVDDKLPFPLEVEGDLTKGRGTTYYQFVVPMERKGAATQPSGGNPTAATQPTGGDATPATRPSIFN